MDDRTPSTKKMPMDGRYESTIGYNSGRDITKAAAGQTIQEDFGLDRSSVVTARESERGGGMRGGPTDLSHSLQGVMTNNHGADKRGNTDKTKTPTKIKY